MKKDLNPVGKLSDVWLGPFVVEEASPLSYRLRHAETGKLWPHAIHVSHLKKFTAVVAEPDLNPLPDQEYEEKVPSAGASVPDAVPDLRPHGEPDGFDELADWKAERSADSHAVPESDGSWEVERILDKTTLRSGDVLYQVKWVGDARPTWEPSENLDGCRRLVREFEQGIAGKEALFGSSRHRRLAPHERIAPAPPRKQTVQLTDASGLEDSPAHCTRSRKKHA